MRLADILAEVAIAAPIIVECEELIQTDTPAGTSVDLPTIHARINGRRIDLDVRATAR